MGDYGSDLRYGVFKEKPFDEMADGAVGKVRKSGGRWSIFRSRKWKEVEEDEMRLKRSGYRQIFGGRYSLWVADSRGKWD